MAHQEARFSSSRPYQYQLGVDIQRGDRLFSAFGKTIYRATWISQAGPPIVLVEIKGARATREASFYAQLSCHPHIVRTFGFVESAADTVVLVQERAHEDLSERFDRDKLRPSSAVLQEIFLQITEAMVCLADNHIVHGDLACRNVLVYEFDNHDPSKNLVKLTDFGLTRVSTAAATGTVIPIRYAAPEVIAVPPSYSEKSDVYSMGTLMWEALSAGQMPFSAITDDDEIRRRKLHGETLEKPDGCEQELWTIIRRSNI